MLSFSNFFFFSSKESTCPRISYTWIEIFESLCFRLGEKNKSVCFCLILDPFEPSLVVRFLLNFLPLIAPEVDQFSSSTLYWLFYIRSTLSRGQVRLHIDWVNAERDIPCRLSQRWVFKELKSLLKFVGKIEKLLTIPHWLSWCGLSPCGLFQRRVRLYVDWVNAERSECRISRRTQK
jgi:hypothetical protein